MLDRPLPLISVVVCTYNGRATIARTLECLAAQTLPTAAFELIVVDDGSSDGTDQFAAQAGATVVRQLQNGGLAAARNTGFRHASAPIVAFTDDDCEPSETWLAEVLAAFDDDSVSAVSGLVVPIPDTSISLRFLQLRNPLRPLPGQLMKSARPSYRLRLYLESILQLGREPEPVGDLYSVVGANMAFRTSLLGALDGFDPAFRFGGEEEELSRRAHTLSPAPRLVYRPAAVVSHRFVPGFGDALRRARAYGRGNARMAAKHTDVNLIVFPFPLAALATVFVAAASRRRSAWLAALALPCVTYLGWTVTAWRRRDPEVLLYPYLQMAQELATMVGEYEGHAVGYVPGEQPESAVVAVGAR